MIEIIQLPALSDNYIYLLHEPEQDQTAVVDPAVAEPVMLQLQEKGWSLNFVFNTHHHADHVGANLELKRLTSCKIVGAAADRDRIPGIDMDVDDGDTVQLGDESLQVIASPGHTTGHIVYYNQRNDLLFCGDTLFSMGCGRLFEGSAEQMWSSLQRLKDLPESTMIYCAHEYTQSNGNFALTLEADNPALQRRLTEVARLRAAGLPTIPTSLAQELATNPFLREHCIQLQDKLGMSAQPLPEIFARIRELKDHFS